MSNDEDSIYKLSENLSKKNEKLSINMLKNKIRYLKNEGHYDNKPTPFKPRKGKNFYIKNNENFKDSLIRLANEKRSH